MNLFKLAIASGKGGVGKSMLSSTLAMLAAKDRSVTAIDCDVDTPNLNIWMGGIQRWDKVIPVKTSERPRIDYSRCDGCGACVDNCRFNAMKIVEGRPILNTFLCEGCGVCEIVCPQKSIELELVQNGEIRIKKIIDNRFISYLVSGYLFPGESGSGKIVSEIKNTADDIWRRHEIPERNRLLEIIDSAPGTGCPVTAALRGTDFVVLITEPTLSGFSDLRHILDVIGFFKLSFGVVINKWDINKSISQSIENEFGSKILGKISYDKNIFKSISGLTPIIKTKLRAKEEIEDIYNVLKNRLGL